MSKFFKTMSVNISDVEKDCSPLITIILVCIFYFKKKTSDRVLFNVNNVLFGGELPFRCYNKVVSFIILYIKQYIFNCSKKQKNKLILLI